MDKTPTSPRLLRALCFALLCALSGSSFATPTRGSQFNNWCAKQPLQATPPQQSRPYQAAGSACSVCHTSGNPSNNDLNVKGTASANCNGSGTATTCGATLNPYCIATAPANATISAPAAGTSVAQGASLTFSAGNASNPDGFPLTYNWSFSSGQPAVSGQSVAVPMTVAGTVTTTLQVRNSVGMLATGTTPTRSVTVSASGGGNQAPSASIVAPAANASIGVGGTVNFQGSGSDPDNNTPLSYSWSFPGGSPASSTAQNPGNVSYATAGNHTASLVVRDSLGLASASVSRTISVGSNANLAPSASIVSPGVDAGIPAGGSVSFAGAGNDPDNNTPLSYSWSFPGGSPASSTLQNPGAVSYTGAGNYSASLTVRDSLGLASATVSRNITVSGTPGANQAPLAAIVTPAADLSIARGGRVYYQGSGVDPDNNTPLSYRWSFPGGSPATSTAPNPGSVSYASSGSYTATLVVTDSLGQVSGSASRSITVIAATAPVASITAPTGNVGIIQGRSVSFTGSGRVSNSSRLPLTYRWTFPGGNPASSTLRSPGPVQFNSVGSQVVSLVVTDSRGLSSNPVLRTINVAPPPPPPVARIVAPAINVSLLPGGSFSFRGAASGGALPLSYRWTFAGASSTGSTLQNPGAVRFSRPGSYPVTLTVTDASGNRSATQTRLVSVAAANQIPAAVSQCTIADDEHHDDEHDDESDDD